MTTKENKARRIFIREWVQNIDLKQHNLPDLLYMKPGRLSSVVEVIKLGAYQFSPPPGSSRESKI